MESKDLSIVIVTYKSEGKIYNCLDSIPNNIKVKIVENSNDKNFKSKIESKYRNVKCILTGSNKGYAIANNIGLNDVDTRFALVLNPDTILDKTAIDNFFIAEKKIEDFWLIGPASDQQVNKDFNDNHILEVNNLKGFAIFFNMKKFNRNFFDENYFLYFEEIDLCKKVKKNNGKIFLDKNILIKHEGASSVEKTKKMELEKNRNWHWMWSTFYFHKKYNGFFFALINISPKFISSIFKTLFYLLILNNVKRDIYFCRFSGIINSIMGKKSWYRPSLD
jgi:N-acetylglucosaminyl-diphospho-decaprenol L-rhamnosyltransferase